VPPLVRLRVAEAEVGAQVDEPPPFREPGAGLLRGLARGKGREHDLGVPDVAPDQERGGRAVEVLLDVAERLAVVRARHRRDEADLRMAQEDARELAARVARDADDRRLDRHRRPIMRRNAYLCKRLLREYPPLVDGAGDALHGDDERGLA